jgi:hypothetical protein
MRGHRPLQRNDEEWPPLSQFRTVVNGKLAEDFFTFRREADEHLPAILVRAMPPHATRGGEAVDQFDGTVMPDLQPLGELGDTGTRSPRQAFEGQHQLMLLRLEAGLASRLLAEVQEAPQLVTDLRQRFVVR